MAKDNYKSFIDNLIKQDLPRILFLEPDKTYIWDGQYKMANKAIPLTKEYVRNRMMAFLTSPRADEMLDILGQKNKQYGGSWQSMGSMISLADIKDKLKRQETVMYEKTIDGKEMLIISNPAKFDEVIFDLFIRSMMILVWRTEHEGKEIFGHIEES